MLPQIVRAEQNACAISGASPTPGWHFGIAGGRLFVLVVPVVAKRILVIGVHVVTEGAFDFDRISQERHRLSQHIDQLAAALARKSQIRKSHWHSFALWLIWTRAGINTARKPSCRRNLVCTRLWLNGLSGTHVRELVMMRWRKSPRVCPFGKRRREDTKHKYRDGALPQRGGG